MAASSPKSLMRCVGEFFGHIAKAVRTDPAKTVMRRETEEEDRGNVILRRTTIEEVEIRGGEEPTADSR